MTGADTLRDYWSGHGHAGPSHGAERDAIAWGTPGDFDRCVAQVTVHGKMTPDQAKGYCNLRHHDALGIWPAQHAKEERGKSVGGTTKASGSMMSAGGGGGGSDEGRVPSGSATGGQYTTGSDGPAPKQKNPFAGGKTPSFAKKPASGKKPDKHEQHEEHLAHEHHEHEEHEQHLKDDPKAAKTKPAKAKATAKKSVGPLRDTPTGRFRTFQGELQEAKQALAEGRMSDVVELLGSARALATTPGQRLVLGELQGAMARTQHVVPQITKVGPHGWSHGWKRAEDLSPGDKIDHATGPYHVDRVGKKDSEGAVTVEARPIRPDGSVHPNQMTRLTYPADHQVSPATNG